MTCFHTSFSVATTEDHQVVDITDKVHSAVAASAIADGICVVFTPHATAAITINENDDPDIGKDFLRALRQLVAEHDGWLHDQVDNNAAAHIKAALVGPSESVPVRDGTLGLGRWQNVFLCEFDGPRAVRNVVITIVG